MIKTVFNRITVEFKEMPGLLSWSTYPQYTDEGNLFYTKTSDGTGNEILAIQEFDNSVGIKSFPNRS